MIIRCRRVLKTAGVPGFDGRAPVGYNKAAIPCGMAASQLSHGWGVASWYKRRGILSTLGGVADFDGWAADGV